MAERPQSPRPKRRLRPAPAETVRERAAKAQINAAQPAKQGAFHHMLRGFMSPLRFVGRGFGWVGRFIIPPYLRNSWRELRLVTWPNRKQSRQLTFAVILFAVIFGTLVAGVDWGLDKLFKQVVLK